MRYQEAIKEVRRSFGSARCLVEGIRTPEVDYFTECLGGIVWFIFVIFACAAWVRFTIWFMLDFEGGLMQELTLDEAAAILTRCSRDELRDHAFGDSEVFWKGPSGQSVAEGYFGGGSSYVHFDEFPWTQVGGAAVRFEQKTFKGADADRLRSLGVERQISRNDETGPDEFVEGKMLDSMTKGAVFEELTGNKLQED